MTDNRIKTIADANGFKVILNKLTEECGELITAIARKDYRNFYEEAADVSILIEQLRLQDEMLFDLYRKQKIKRQLERMGKQC